MQAYCTDMELYMNVYTHLSDSDKLGKTRSASVYKWTHRLIKTKNLISLLQLLCGRRAHAWKFLFLLVMFNNNQSGASLVPVMFPSRSISRFDRRVRRSYFQKLTYSEIHRPKPETAFFSMHAFNSVHVTCMNTQTNLFQCYQNCGLPDCPRLLDANVSAVPSTAIFSAEG